VLKILVALRNKEEAERTQKYDLSAALSIINDTKISTFSQVADDPNLF